MIPKLFVVSITSALPRTARQSGRSPSDPSYTRPTPSMLLEPEAFSPSAYMNSTLFLDFRAIPSTYRASSHSRKVFETALGFPCFSPRTIRGIGIADRVATRKPLPLSCGNARSVARYPAACLVVAGPSPGGGAPLIIRPATSPRLEPIPREKVIEGTHAGSGALGHQGAEHTRGPTGGTSDQVLLVQRHNVQGPRNDNFRRYDHRTTPWALIKEQVELPFGKHRGTMLDILSQVVTRRCAERPGVARSRLGLGSSFGRSENRPHCVGILEWSKSDGPRLDRKDSSRA